MLIKELFSEYTENIPNPVGRGELLKICHSKDGKQMVLFAKFTQLQRFDNLDEFERAAAKAVGLDYLRVKCRYTPDMLDAKYTGEAVKRLKQDMAVINGHLNGAFYYIDNNTVHIELKRGGAELLSRAGFENALAKLLNEEFSVKLTVKLIEKQTEQDNDYHYEQMMKQVYSDSLPIPDPDIPARPAYVEEAPQTVTVDFKDIPVMSDGAEIVKGKRIYADSVTNIGDINEARNGIVIWGDVFDYAEKEIKNKKGEEKRITTVSLTDYTGSISIKDFADKDSENVLAKLKKGCTVVIRGKADFDTFDNEFIMRANDIMLVKKLERTDTCEEKRVELHMHTNMSQMDAITPADKLIKRAYSWGHKAIAITDHGVCQGYPEAMLAADDIHKSDPDFKLIYGCEAYFVDDMVPCVYGVKDQPLDGEFCVFDTETTGLDPGVEYLTEIGGVIVRNGEVVEEFDTFVKPGKPITPKITELTGITNEMVDNAPSEAEALKAFSATCEREGAALSVVLTGYCDKIDAIAEGVRVKMPEIVAALKTKLTERLEEALAGPVAAKSALTREEAGERIRQEVTLYALKVDVDEEINRLKTHTAEVRRVLQAGGAVGKRLDFLMQEMNREANTLGSKAAAIEMTDASVNLKLLIEQMREQIQNLQ